MTSRPLPSVAPTGLPRRGRSPQALAVAAFLTATRRRRSLGERVAGVRLPTSAPPAARVRDVAAVTSYPLDGHTVWRLQPLAPPATGGAVPLVVYLHGGAFLNGIDPFHWRFVAGLIARTGAEVLVPEYPLTPPATVEQTLPWSVAAYAEPAASARAQGRRVVLMGDSAGANLALTTAVAARDAGLTVPDEVALLSPWLDVAGLSPGGIALDRHDPMLDRVAGLEAGRMYAGAPGVADPRVSPVHADLAGLRITSWCGDRDQVVADQRELARRAAAAGWDVATREVPGMVHCFMLIDLLPEARATAAEIAAVVSGG
ncbi:alpha/beta hydrolase [Nocardioidaceae bacterium]|nr:alpha/beta hydrolase [Nocardioidaceae bacterium]